MLIMLFLYFLISLSLKKTKVINYVNIGAIPPKMYYIYIVNSSVVVTVRVVWVYYLTVSSNNIINNSSLIAMQSLMPYCLQVLHLV